MSNEVQKTTDYSKDRDIIEVVRGSIFPNSTDAEMKLYMFQCNEVGVHPMSRMITPVVFVDSSGTRRLSFITTIDLFRTRSEESGEYDGMDRIEFIGEGSFEEDGKIVVHPLEAVCNVYRKGIDRPFVGVAYWEEFYPGNKKGHMWRKMPRIMLGKCAEAQARRLAFPKKLNQLYTAEEMDRGFESLATTGAASSKPSVTSAQVHVSDTTVQADDGEVKDMVRPTDAQREAGKLVSEKQAYLMIGECKKAGVEHRSVAKAANVQNVFWLTWQKSSKVNFNVLLELVKTKPNSFSKFSQAAETAQQATTQTQQQPAQDQNVPSVMDAEEFATIIEALAMQAGISVTQGLMECVGVDSPSKVPAVSQSKAVDFFTAKAETPAA